MSVLGIIPARGGSKRIPRKNIKDFLGKPIIAYSIEAAIKSQCFDEVMVSTENEEIAAISKEYGAAIPFYRSLEAANDYAMLADVLTEVLSEYQKIGRSFSYVCCILPSPFITAQRLEEGLTVIKKTQADAVFPVVRYSPPVQQSARIKNGFLEMVDPKGWAMRTQDMEDTYYDVGQFYWLETKSFLVQKKVFAAKTVPLIFDESEAQDIDTAEDWNMAEVKYKDLLQRFSL